MRPGRAVPPLGYHSLAAHALPQQRLGDAMHNQVGIAADGRGEVRVGGRGQRKVAFVDLRVARLLERAQHQVAQNPLLRLALDLGGQLLIHARRHRNVFGHLVRADDCGRCVARRGGRRASGCA